MGLAGRLFRSPFLLNTQTLIRAIIIDDDLLIRKEIREKIESNFKDEILIISESESVKTGIQEIEKYEPNLLFLDIHLKDGTGFDIIERSEYKNFEVIFITGYDEHAIQAIKVGALDYILKPIDEIELIESVNNAIGNISKEKHIGKLIEIASEHYKGVEKKRIILKTLESIFVLNEDDIIYCNSEGNYSTIFTSNMNKIVVSKSMKKIEELLSKKLFIRCHQSYLVNKNHIIRYDKRGKLIVSSNHEVPVSSRRKEYTLQSIYA